MLIITKILVLLLIAFLLLFLLPPPVLLLPAVFFLFFLIFSDLPAPTSALTTGVASLVPPVSPGRFATNAFFDSGLFTTLCLGSFISLCPDTSAFLCLEPFSLSAFSLFSFPRLSGSSSVYNTHVCYTISTSPSSMRVVRSNLLSLKDDYIFQHFVSLLSTYKKRLQLEIKKGNQKRQ